MSQPDHSPTQLQDFLTVRVVIAVLLTMLVFTWYIGSISALAAIGIFAVISVLLLQTGRSKTPKSHDTTNNKPNGSTVATRQNGAIKSVRSKTLHAVPLPILIIGEDHSVSFANHAAEDLLGDEVVGNDVYLYLRHTKIAEAIQKIFVDGKKFAGVVRYTNSQKRSFDVTISRVSGTGSKDVTTQAIAFFYEVTSMIQTEQMRVDFVANASHELRTPLSSVIGFIETLQGPAKDDVPARERFLSIMQTETERMVRLIDDLLSLSRIEMSRHESPDSEVNLTGMINSIVLTASAVGKERDITFEASIAAGAEKVIADPDQLTQVLINLSVNAAKYADRGTTVFVSAAMNEDDNKINISIRDEGPGILQEHVARLTERFYRIDDARSRQMGGTGLGLAIVKHILLRHDSLLNVESHVGKGSIFSFTLKAPENNSCSQTIR